MASRHLYDRLLASDFVQFRLNQIPRGARWTWLVLMRAMSVADEPGTLRFGSLLRMIGMVAAIASIPEAEAEEDVETLVSIGLLTRDGNGVLRLPPALMSQIRGRG